MSTAQLGVIDTRIPARLDRLPWSRFHRRVIFGLGTAWILDGLEVTIVGSIASRLTAHDSGLPISAGGIGTAAALYVVGACLGALLFGQLTDRFGRRKLFMITLGIYMAATALTAVSFAPWFFFVFRLLTGAGIGGEYAAINSAIDELIPARARGRVDLIVNGSFWVGALMGSALSILFLDEAIFPANVGWRLTFAIGIVLGSAVLLVRRHVPESPRWLFIHGREQEAEALVADIEATSTADTGAELSAVTKTLTVRQRRAIGFGDIAKTAVRAYPRRSILCLALFVGQAFIYNGITFNLGTLLGTFFAVSSGIAPVFLIVYAASNFLGPLSLGRLFDTIGRKPMVAGTYLGSAALGVLLAGLFVVHGLLGPWSFIVVVMATFFLASAGASAAYLTSSEIFPMETRALAIAFFYAVGTAVGGITGPLLFGPLIATKSRGLVAVAFLVGSALMAVGGVVELFFGVDAERVPLEDVAKPLTAEDAERMGETPTERDPTGETGGRPDPGRHRSEARLARQRAAEERARAAEHRASAHAQRAATAGDQGATERAETAELLAEISDATALAHDELALAADERAEAELNGTGRAAESKRSVEAGGERKDGAPALLRAVAAGHRATSHHEEAEALAAGGDDPLVERHRELAAVALELARQHEQLAAAALIQSGAAAKTGAARDAASGEQGDGAHPLETQDNAQVDRARTEMHEWWAQVHAERARVHECRASGDGPGAARAERSVAAMQELAMAAACRAEAAERRDDARRVLEEESEAQEIERLEGEEAQRRAARKAERDAEDARVRARLERRRGLTGVRRYRPGPGRLGVPPAITSVAPFPEEALDREILAIERALHEHGATDRRELARMVGAAYWGSGVFAEALRLAVAEGGIRRLSRDCYDSPPDAGQQATS